MSRVVDNQFLKNLERTKQKKLMVLLEEVLKEYAPKEFKQMGQENLKIFLNLCYLNAQNHGTENFGEIKAFTFLAFHLGVEFYKDPLYTKIVTIFESSSPIEIKLNRAINHFLKEQYVYTKKQLLAYKHALDRLEKVAFHVITEPISAQKMAAYLNVDYPERVTYLGGKEYLSKLMPNHYEELKAHQLDTPLGHFTFFMLWMFLGSSFLIDPRYAWVQKAFYMLEENPNRKSHKFLQNMLKRLKKEKQKVVKQLAQNEHEILRVADFSRILSGVKLERELVILKESF